MLNALFPSTKGYDTLNLHTFNHFRFKMKQIILSYVSISCRIFSGRLQILEIAREMEDSESIIASDAIL